MVSDPVGHGLSNSDSPPRALTFTVDPCNLRTMNTETRVKREVVKRVKTTVEFPEELWKAAKVLAVEERRSFQDVVAAALEEYLKRRKKGGKKNGS